MSLGRILLSMGVRVAGWNPCDKGWKERVHILAPASGSTPMKGVAVNGEAIGRCMGELINALSVAHEQQVEPLDGTTSSWMRKMKELGVPENALPFFLAGAQTTVYSDGN